ncbi:MAG: TonB-dependent receptor [Salinivirgaceae bacterium]|jgi:outer membrane receptor protein involved in Fe transport|nr:TonB-dependent receptor [Salinivirgaceae bacterium]
MKKIYTFLTVLLLATISPFAAAQEEEESVETMDLYEMSLEELMDIKVVSASKTSQSQEFAPNIIDAMPAREITRYGFTDLNEIAAQYPGFSFSQDYDRRTLNFRGMFEGWNNNHYLTLIDGVPFNDNLYGTSYTWEITPLAFAKNIEIIRGPGGALYGSSAMNGVFTINTMAPKDLGGIGMARVRSGGTNDNIIDVVVGQENDNFELLASFNSFYTKGSDYETFDASVDVNELPENNSKYNVRDNRSSQYFFAKVKGKQQYEGLEIQYHEQHWEYETGHGWLFEIPDQYENLQEYRRILAAKYALSPSEKLNIEATAKYQIHGIDWDLQYYKTGAFGGFYPNATSEYLKTDAEDFFTRIQADYTHNDHIFMAGVESDIFYYDGDQHHFSNTDLNDAGGFTADDGSVVDAGTGYFYPFPNGEQREMGPWFEFVKNNPVYNAGAFLQYISPWFFERLQVTASGRFDRQWFTYNQIYEPGKPENDKTFEQFTPRLAAVMKINDQMSIKALFGQSFRYPAPTEMFGSNTWTLGSNIEQLKPESSTNYDLAFNIKPNENMKLKLNAYYVDFQNQIAYSVQNQNLSTNLYSLQTAGVEFDIRYKFNEISGFMNLSYARRINEDIKDTTITEHPDEITWAAAINANLGVNYTKTKFYVSGWVHFQGPVQRRDSDISENYEGFRPDEIDPWVNVNVKAAYRITTKSEIGIIAKNVLDQDQYIIKNNLYAFDYKRPGARVSIDFTVRF